MENVGKISIIVPVYNSAQYLTILIDSISTQNYMNFELLLINDGSTDNSKEIIEKAMEIDDRIKLINKINGGVSSARNAGIEAASGKYITFIDSDDAIEKSFLKATIKLMEKEESEFVLAGYTFIYYEKGKKNKRIDILPNCNSDEVYSFLYNNFAQLLNKKIIASCCSKIYLAKYVKKYIRFDTSMVIGEDMKFVLEYLKLVKKVSILNETGYEYRIHETESITKRYFSKRQKNTERLFEMLQDFLSYFNIYSTLQLSAITKYYYRSTFMNLELLLNNKSEFYKVVKYIQNENKMLCTNSMENIVYFLFLKCNYRIVYFFVLVRKKIKRTMKRIVKN